jgi:signal transduction histidine kinase
MGCSLFQEKETQAMILPANTNSQPDILIVDDSPVNLKLLEKMLRDAGYESRSFLSGKRALQGAINNPPDLMFLDISMPEMDGYELCHELKKIASLKDIPVIFISSLSQMRDKVKAFQTGAVDYITKPFNFDEVRSRLQTHLNLRKIRIDLEHSNSELHCAIKNLKQTQAQLVHSQKMQSVGRLAAGLAHEINTPLQYIESNMHFLRDSVGELRRTRLAYHEILDAAKKGPVDSHLIEKAESEIAKTNEAYLDEENALAIEQTLGGIQNINNIILSTKEFARSSSKEAKPINLNRSIENTLVVAKSEWEPIATVTTDLDPNLPLVPCLEGELNLALLNIVTNAAQAIDGLPKSDREKKGTIRISSRLEEKHAVIRIEDTGIGISEHDRQNIFDPFFTTKDVGQGIGQGLHSAYDVIVNKHNGAIEVASKKGQGSSFILRIPFQGIKNAQVN